MERHDGCPSKITCSPLSRSMLRTLTARGYGRQGMGWRIAAGVAMALAAACAPAAQASFVDVEDFGDPVGLSVHYVADAGEANDLTISGDGAGGVLVQDPGAV